MNTIVILMTRVPKPGTAKTRLIPLLGNEGAAALQQAMCRDVGLLLQQQERPIVFYTDGEQAAVPDLVGFAPEAYVQRGTDLGERMAHAFEKGFALGADAAVIIGSDLPHLPQEILAKALELLDEHDAVIGPSADGGYYLIGFTADGFFEDIFYNQAWGTETVLTSAEVMLEANYRSYCLLEELEDIDTPEDLQRFAGGDMSGAPHTAAFVEQNRDRIEED